MSPSMIFAIGLVTVVLMSVFVYVTIHEITKPEPPMVPLNQQLGELHVDRHRPLKVLLALDGSPSSLAAVAELASCTLPRGSAIEVLTVIHSQLPFVPDPSFSAAAAYSEAIEEQQRRAPTVLQAVMERLRPHQRHLEVSTKVLEGEPAQVILDEAAHWGADRIVLGSHGYGRLKRAAMGSTARRVAGEAPCSVYVVRAHATSENERATTPITAMP